MKVEELFSEEDLKRFLRLCTEIRHSDDLLRICGEPDETIAIAATVRNRVSIRQHVYHSVLSEMSLFVHEFSDFSVELSAMPKPAKEEG